jgi:hypothetical protein
MGVWVKLQDNIHIVWFYGSNCRMDFQVYVLMFFNFVMQSEA